MTGSTMEAKAARFLTQFARVVFVQWTQQEQERELFWKDESFLHGLLEEAAAKLPRGALKSHLTRELQPLVTQLATLLQDKYVEYLTQQAAPSARSASASASASFSQGALLNEELTELALAQATAASDSDRYRRLTGVLALDAALDVAPHTADAAQQEGSTLERATRLAEQFALVAARSYESASEQAHKRGLALRRLADCVQQHLATQCSSSSNWECSAESAAGRELQQLRALLERVVAQDAVTMALPQSSPCTSMLSTPWTAFYRPEEPKELQKVSFDAEMAKVYGSLLALAVYFPLDLDEDEQSSAEDTSDDSSSDEDQAASHETATRSQKQELKPLDAVPQAQQAVRQVLLAAQIRQRTATSGGQWLIKTLSFLHVLPKPATYLDEDEDAALETEDRRALLESLGEVYTRGFAGAVILEQFKDGSVGSDKAAAEQDSALFEAAVCLRHAAQFMRSERKCSLAAVTTAIAQLAGVPLPASFSAWLDHERRSAASASAPAKLAHRLWKLCSNKPKMANMLLSATDVTDEELGVMQERYEAYLQRMAAGTLNQQHQVPKATGTMSGPTDASASEPQPEEDSLFFVDNAGGEKGTEDGESKKRKKNAAKRAAKKRSRAAKKLKTQGGAEEVAQKAQAAATSSS